MREKASSRFTRHALRIMPCSSEHARRKTNQTSSATGLGMTRAIAVTACPPGKRTRLDDHFIRDIATQQEQLQRIGESSFTPV